MGKIAVLGLGESVKLFDPIEYELSIGVNDIWRIYHTEVVVCVDNPRAFTPDRYRVIHDSTPKAFYSQMVVWDTRPDFHKIEIIPGYPETSLNLDTPGYYKSYCSPFIACQVAFKMYGADEIHLFGVDLINHPHLNGDLCAKIKNHFVNLNKALFVKNCRLVIHGNGILTIQTGIVNF